jgi:PKD repeat protein
MDDRGALAASTRFLNLNKPPVISFAATCTGLRCTFDASASFDTDGTIEVYIWSFGDGRDGVGGTTITHTYAAPGTYTVTLTARDNVGATVTHSQTVTVVSVNAPPVASFTSACAGLTCTFDASGSSDSDGTIASYAWSFGDATTGSGVTPNHTYAAAGTYTVGLVVMDNSGATSSKSSSVTVDAPPVASFTVTCTALTCTFDGSTSSDSDGTIASYAWSFGDSTTGSGATSSHTYTASGTYTVSLTVRDNVGATGVRAGSVTVSQSTMHIGDIDGARTNQQNTWTALVTLRLHNSNHGSVANATVSGSWSIGGTASCTTDGTGQCVVSKSAIPKNIKSVTFTIVNATNATLLYRPADNHDPDADSNGTSIAVSNP